MEPHRVRGSGPRRGTARSRPLSPSRAIQARIAASSSRQRASIALDRRQVPDGQLFRRPRRSRSGRRCPVAPATTTRRRARGRAWRADRADVGRIGVGESVRGPAGGGRGPGRGRSTGGRAAGRRRRGASHHPATRGYHPPMTTTSFWHGFADMHTVKDAELVFRSGDGVWLEATDGRRFLDSTAGLWYCAVGYGRQAIADAVAEQLTRLSAYSSFGAFTTEPTVQLAERLSALAPIDDAVVFFGSGGSDGVDTAAKLVRRYWDVQGQPEKRIIVVARARLPRDARLGHLAGRHPRQQGRLRRGDHRRGRHGRARRHRDRWARCSSGRGTRSRRSSASPSSGRAGCTRRNRRTGRRSSGCAGSTTSCSSPTRSSPGSVGRGRCGDRCAMTSRRT